MFEEEFKKINDVEKKTGRSHIVKTTWQNHKYATKHLIGLIITLLFFVCIWIRAFFFEKDIFYSLPLVFILMLLSWLAHELFIRKVQFTINSDLTHKDWSIFQFCRNLENNLFFKELSTLQYSKKTIENMIDWKTTYDSKPRFPFLNTNIGLVIFTLITAFMFEIIKSAIVTEGMESSQVIKNLSLGLYLLLILFFLSYAFHGFFIEHVLREKRLINKLSLYKIQLYQ